MGLLRHDNLTMVTDGHDVKAAEVNPPHNDLIENLEDLVALFLSINRGHIDGFIMSRTGATEITFSKGSAMGLLKLSGGVSVEDRQNIILSATTIAKDLSSPWEDGTSKGGRADGVSLATGIYHCFVLGKADGTADAGFDNVATGQNLLDDTDVIGAGYITARHVGFVYYDGDNSEIWDFYQQGDLILLKNAWDAGQQSVNGMTTVSFSNILPSGLLVNAIVDFACGIHIHGTAYGLVGSDLYVETADIPTSSQYMMSFDNEEWIMWPTEFIIPTNNSQVKIRYHDGEIIHPLLLGWIYSRGKDT